MTVKETQKPHSTSFTEALMSKYCQQEDFDDKFSIPKDSGISTEIAFVGFDKVVCIQRQLHRLTNIDLSGKGIAISGNCDLQLKKKLINVRTLNLDRNNLGWTQLAPIIDLLPNLKELIISRNLLHIQGQCPSDGQDKKKISSLTAGYYNSDWDTILKTLSYIWDQIEQLDLWSCGLSQDRMYLKSRDAATLKLVSNIRSLRLSQNNLASFDWISKIGPIEYLQELDISNCRMKKLTVTESVSQLLSHLRTLNISYNDLHDWQDVDSLNGLKSLNSLICHENPFFISEKLAKPYTIARLGRITTLNREEINSRLRRDSEILYLRVVTQELSEKSDHEALLKSHSRYEELLGLYGKPEIPVARKGESRFIKVNLKHEKTTVSRMLPRDMRVSDLRMLCRRLFRLSARDPFRIVYHNNANIKYELDRDVQTLDFFSIPEDSELMVEV